MNDFELTDEIKSAWRHAKQIGQQIRPPTPGAIILANALRDCLAAKMRAEHPYRFYRFDPRYSWQWSDWQAAAEKELRGESK